MTKLFVEPSVAELAGTPSDTPNVPAQRTVAMQARIRNVADGTVVELFCPDAGGIGVDVGELAETLGRAVLSAIHARSLERAERLPTAEAVLSFATFRLNIAEERLWRGDRELQLRRKPFAILRYLAQNPKRLVSYTELVDAIWGRGSVISESLVRTHIHDLRRVLVENVIETVQGRGYRFVPSVHEGGEAGIKRDVA